MDNGSVFDAASNSLSLPFSTNLTKNLGLLDGIVSDKRRTLTPNKLTRLAFMVDEQ
jgi:hypothetical protein